VKRIGLALAAATWSAALPRVAAADPQPSAGLTVGGVFTDLRQHGSFGLHMGARADLVFGRTSERSAGFGPYVDLATAEFDTLEIGGGGQWLLPFRDEFLWGLSAGGLARHALASAPWEPGVAATLHFWARSYNYEAPYGLANGAFVQARYGFGDSKQTDIIFGVQIDLALLAIPFLPLAGIVR
jgi:hypothetical protein